MIENTSRTTRVDFLDGLRALAALAVLVHHAQLEVWVGSSASRIAYLGRLSVDVFIVLSGFCLMLPVLRAGGRLAGGARRFFTRRARRLLPPYYAALALSLLLVWTIIGHQTGTHWDSSLPVTTNGVLAHLLMLQDLVHRHEINHPMWSVALEWHIYFLFPLLLLPWARLGAVATAGGAVLASLLVFVALRGTGFAEVPVHFVGLFALGMLGAQLAFAPAAAPRATAWALATAALALLVLALVVLGWSAHLSWPRAAVLDSLAGLTTMTALVALVRAPRARLTRLLEARPLQAVGLFSYSLYLIHAPLLHVVWTYALAPLGLGQAATFALLVGLGGPVIVGASYLFFLGFERPFLRPRPVAEVIASMGDRRPEYP